MSSKLLLALYTTKYITATVLVRALSVRIHAGIIHNRPWNRFWYLCRALDLSGQGRVELPVEAVCHLTSISRSTLYQWLREGKAAGAFRRYRFKGNTLSVYLGGLQKYCQSLGLTSWQAVASVPLIDILSGMSLKSHATALQTQSLQVKSRYAAIRSLNNRERKHTKVAEVEAIFEQGQESSQKPVRGQVPFLLKVGYQRIFVSKGFAPFGTSQPTIAATLGISDRTLRRHLDHLGVERRQIVQTKAAYKSITKALEWWAQEWEAEPGIGYKEDRCGQIWMNDMNGRTSSRKPAQIITKERFFQYQGKTWIYRCNLYKLDYATRSMRAAQDSYRKLIAQNPCAGAIEALEELIVMEEHRNFEQEGEMREEGAEPD